MPPNTVCTLSLLCGLGQSPGETLRNFKYFSLDWSWFRQIGVALSRSSMCNDHRWAAEDVVA